MRTLLLLLTAILATASSATASSAYANDRWEARASMGLGRSKVIDIYDVQSTSLTLQFDGGLRLSPTATLGLHFGIAPRTKQVVAFPESMFDQEWDFSLTPVHLGVMGQFAIADTVWIEPWIGIQNVVRHTDCYIFYDKRVAGGQTTKDCSGKTTYDRTMQLAVGVQLGVKVWHRASESISVLASIEHASARDDVRADETGSDLTEEYEGAWLGVGYGF